MASLIGQTENFAITVDSEVYQHRIVVTHRRAPAADATVPVALQKYDGRVFSNLADARRYAKQALSLAIGLESDRIGRGTKVRIRTTNGGEVTGILSTDYRPTYAVSLAGLPMPIAADRIRSVDPA